MKRYRRTILGLFVAIGCMGSWASVVLAQSGKIFPVLLDQGDPIQPYKPVQSEVTLSVKAIVDGSDINQDGWPQPGQVVKIEVRVGGAPVQAVLALAEPCPSGDPISEAINSKVLWSSNYPGICTNVDTPSNFPSDRDFNLVGDSLTVFDTGGMAVLTVSIPGRNPLQFIIPQDSDFDGIPDWYESKSCGSHDCLNRVGDIDIVPEGASQTGDGIANIDEYRGFRVGGSYGRGNPVEKDIFVHFVENAQCTGTASEMLGSSPIRLATFYGANFSPLFGNMNSLVPGRKVYQLWSEEWVDHFDFYSDSTSPSVHLKLGTDPVTDRQINKNSLSPLGIMKGVRLLECLDLLKTSPLGLSSKQPPDGNEDDDGTAVIFTQRIWKSYKYKFKSGAGRLLKYFTYSNLSWGAGILPAGQTPVPTSDSNQDFLNHQGVFILMRDKTLPFYAAHEALGHGLDLTPTQEGTSKNPVGYHHVEGTGTNIDISIVHKIDKKVFPDGFNNFYIPTVFGISDKRSMRLYGSPQ